MATTATKKELLNPAEVQEMLGIGRTKVYELITRRELPAVRIGRAVRVRKGDVERFLEGNRY